MSWFRRRPSPEIPPLVAEPLDVPTDLSSGTEARQEALQSLQSVVAQSEETSMWSKLLDQVVQQNHIRDYLLQAHERS